MFMLHLGTKACHEILICKDISTGTSLCHLRPAVICYSNISGQGKPGQHQTRLAPVISQGLVILYFSILFDVSTKQDDTREWALKFDFFFPPLLLPFLSLFSSFISSPFHLFFCTAGLIFCDRLIEVGPVFFFFPLALSTIAPNCPGSET